MPLIAKGMTYRYPRTTAPVLDGFSLDHGAGHVLAVCGAARSGRSTALAVLSGLLAPTAGSVTIDGMRAAAPEARGRAGLLLQNADEALFGLTVREDVMFAPLQLGVAPAEASRRADAALRAVGLDPALYNGRSPFSLSGGQRRRAAIAGLIAMRPGYLLLDEPFVGLDPQGRGEILTVIRILATQGMGQHTGIVVALSDLEMALHLADNLLILHGGRAAWYGSVTEFAGQPPDVAAWGLRRPDLLTLAVALRERGWMLPLDKPSAPLLATAIAAQVRGRRR